MSTATFMVHVEMETVPLYKGQPLMHDIVHLLTGWGFRLIGIENPQYISRHPAMADDRTDQGELISVDGIFCREITDKWIEGAHADVGTITGCVLVLYDLGFRTLAIDTGRRLEATFGKDRDGMLAALTAALREEYRAEESRTRPMAGKLYETLHAAVPARFRRHLRALLPG